MIVLVRYRAGSRHTWKLTWKLLLARLIHQQPAKSLEMQRGKLRVFGGWEPIAHLSIRSTIKSSQSACVFALWTSDDSHCLLSFHQYGKWQAGNPSPASTSGWLVLETAQGKCSPTMATIPLFSILFAHVVLNLDGLVRRRSAWYHL